MARVFFIFAALFFAGDAHAFNLNCDFYLKLETAVECRGRGKGLSSDYLIGYGYRNCVKFQTRMDSWKDERVEWVQDTAQCLQNALGRFHEKHGDGLNCVELERVAFDSHPRCYIDSGFCGLSLKQRMKVMKSLLHPSLFPKGVQVAKQAAMIFTACHGMRR